MALAEKEARLHAVLASLDSALIAFSGGVDSSFLLYATVRALGSRCVAFTTTSAATPADDLAYATRLATTLGVEHVLRTTDEVAIAEYAANPPNRCFFCKDNLFTLCRAEATVRGIATILDGANVDDLSDHRPGLAAAAAQGIRHPLVEAGFTKAEVREASRGAGLAAWDRPASPCLSSRVPYGTDITHAVLARVAAAEAVLRDAGFREFRVRHHDRLARIEVPPEDMPRLLAQGAQVTSALRAIGYLWVTLDLGGFRSGSLNAVLTEKHEGPKG
jgi:uncharacterized protein